MRHQPQGGQARLSALARSLGFTHAFNFGDGTVRPNNLVTGKPGISNAVNASLTGGPGGRGLQLTGTLGDRLEVAGNPFSTSTCTYLWIDSGVDSTANGQCVVQTRYDQSAVGEQYGLEIRILGDSIHILSAQAADRVAVGGRNNAGGMNASAVSINGGYGRHAVFNRGRLLYGAVPSSTPFDPPYQHGTNGIGAAFDCTSSTVQYYGLLFAPKVLPDDVLKFLTANPWLLFAASYEDEVVAVDTSLGPGTAPLTITGFAPSVARGVTTDIAPGAASLTIAGYAPSVTQGLTKTISPAPASLAVIGYAPAVSQTAVRNLAPTATALTITGYAPTVSRGASQTIPAGAAVPSTLQLQGYAPTITQANNVTPHYHDATILQMSSVRATTNLGPDRIQRTADLA